jgi:hypothetical protein
MKKWLRYGLAAAGLVAVAMAARHLDARGLLASLRTMNPALGVAAMILMIGGKVGAKVLRSQRLLEAECARAPTLATTARLLYASHAAGQLAWGPLGFTVRSVALKADGLPVATIARVHVAERIAEACGLVVVACVALVAVQPVAAVLALVLLADLMLIAFGPALARATAWAFASSVADLAVLFLAARAMHVEAGVAPVVIGFLAINVAYLLPTPGQLGVQEAAITLAFTTAGIPAPAALACAVAYRVVHLVPLLVVGVPSLLSVWLPLRRTA